MSMADRGQHKILCRACVEGKLVAPHQMVAVPDLGGALSAWCEWCRSEDPPRYSKAAWLVDMVVYPPST